MIRSAKRILMWMLLLTMIISHYKLYVRYTDCRDNLMKYDPQYVMSNYSDDLPVYDDDCEYLIIITNDVTEFINDILSGLNTLIAKR